MIRRDTSIRVRGRSLYVSSMEIHSAQSAADGSRGGLAVQTCKPKTGNSGIGV